MRVCERKSSCRNGLCSHERALIVIAFTWSVFFGTGEPSRGRLCGSRSSLLGAQYCPVNLRGLGQKANSGGAFRVTWGVSDLNRKWSFALAFRVFATPESPCISARPCSHRPWTFCRGRPSTASSIDTAATTGRVASVAPSSFASWPSRSCPTARACAISKCVWQLKPASFTTWGSVRRSLARRWPMLTSRATGAFTLSWLNG